MALFVAIVSVPKLDPIERNLVHMDFSIKTKRSVCLRLNVLQTIDAYYSKWFEPKSISS